MSYEQLTNDALALSSIDRAHLAETIWESLGEPHSFLSDVNESKALSLACQRDAEIDNGSVTPLSHAKLMERLAQ